MKERDDFAQLALQRGKTLEVSNFQAMKNKAISEKKFLETRRDFCIYGPGEMLDIYSFLCDISLVHQVVCLVFICVFSLSLFLRKSRNI